MLAPTDLPTCSYDWTNLDTQLIRITNPCYPVDGGGGGGGILDPPPPPPPPPIKDAEPIPKPAPTAPGVMDWVKANAWLVLLLAGGGLILYAENKKKKRK